MSSAASDRETQARTLLARRPVIPVLTFRDAAEGIAVARALVAGGLDVLEVTLRTPAALDAIRAVAAEVEGATVGAGTVLSADQARAAEEAGARFLVSPGATPALLAAGDDTGLPWLYGAATVSEAMLLRERGRRFLKFFPAEQSGGAKALKGFAPVLPDLVFCPTGGVDAAKAPDYLALPNVSTVGGSWIVPAQAVAAGDFATITRLAREAAGLARPGMA
ncbi:MAG TPA: bifunctional 4-hydroxy-2-oxoglutarate aldolase/2-dehydro-3-deoxy-phosphogluconate aldolase [Beijerinckiaceae bacterium]|jgi:2-dehydro-3-deoxyphosphogluconate aldolase/(4S)-4-hydroxy-2-oxoglutarate aldolase